jgi:hypothetical protein
MQEELGSPESACKTKMFSIEGRASPAVMLGTSPFIGAGQFCGRASEYYERFYRNPGNIVDIIVEAVRCGIPCVQLGLIDVLVDAFEEACRRCGIGIASTITFGFEDIEAELSLGKKLGATIAFVHAMIADRRNAAELAPILEKVREYGLIPGCATHAPLRTIDFMEESGLDMMAYLAPINAEGYMMGKDPQKLLSLLSATKKTVIAKKSLAAGSIEPERALRYLASLEWLSGVAIGVASLEEARETFGLAVSLWPA